MVLCSRILFKDFVSIPITDIFPTHFSQTHSYPSLRKRRKEWSGKGSLNILRNLKLKFLHQHMSHLSLVEKTYLYTYLQGIFVPTFNVSLYLPSMYLCTYPQCIFVLTLNVYNLQCIYVPTFNLSVCLLTMYLPSMYLCNSWVFESSYQELY